MKFNIKAKVFGKMVTIILKDYYKKHNMVLDKSTVKALYKEYKAINERTPSLREGSPMTDNLIGAAYFFAMAKTIPNMTPTLMDDIITEGFTSPLMIKMHEGEKKKGVLFSDKKQDSMIREAENSQTSTYEMDWKFTYEKHPDEFYLTYTKCGICRLAEREDVLEYLPCMCKMDYPKYAMVGAKLIRDKTLASGDECCNFHVIREKQQ